MEVVQLVGGWWSIVVGAYRFVEVANHGQSVVVKVMVGNDSWSCLPTIWGFMVVSNG